MTLPQHYDQTYRTVGILCTLSLFVLGLAGNILVIFVVSRNVAMQTSTNCYLVSLAVADVLLLISAALPTLVEYFLIVDEFIFGSVGCSLMVFSQYLGVNVSALCITAFTVERFVAICHPLQLHLFGSMKRAIVIILSIWISCAVYSGPWLKLATTQPVTFSDGSSIDKCTFSLPRGAYLVYYICDIVLFYVTPLCVTTFLYTLMAHRLSASVKTFNSQTSYNYRYRKQVCR